MGSANVVPLPHAVLERLRGFDTCTVANAIECFHVRLNNAGYADGSVRCQFPNQPPLVGYAATARLRTGDAPVEGGRFRDRMEWWQSLRAGAAPRIVVLQDVDAPPGRGAFVGDVHAAILHALGCIGFVTNGAVRELPAIEAMGLHLFAASVAVSHAYAHIFDFGVPVEIGGLTIHNGDLLHGDRHGLLQVPAGIAPALPDVADRLRAREAQLKRYCQSPDFSMETLRRMLQREER